MSAKDFNNTGILSRNKRREKDSHPEFSGQCTIDGKQFWISSWVNESKKDGGKYFSLRFKPKMAAEHVGGVKNPPAQKAEQDFNEEVPF